MRVALDTNRLFAAHTGATTYLLDLLPKLLETSDGNDEVVVLYSWRGALPDSLAWLKRHDNFTCERAPFSGGGNDFWRTLRFPAIESLGISSIDVCHSIEATPLPSRTARKVVTLQRLEQPANKAGTRRLRRALRRVDTVVVPARRLKQILVEASALNEDAIEVIPPGVHERYLKAPKSAEVEELCQAFPFLQEPYLLTLGGGADASSSVPFLIRAWKTARRSAAELPPLVVLARRGESAAVVRQIDDNGLAGDLFVLEDLETDALPALYRGAEFVLEPANEGAYGQSVLEAAACGVPAIAHQACGALEVVADGALVPTPAQSGPGSGILDLRADAGLWAEAMVELHRDSALRDELGARARRATADWTWETAARRHWQVYSA